MQPSSLDLFIDILEKGPFKLPTLRSSFFPLNRLFFLIFNTNHIFNGLGQRVQEISLVLECIVLVVTTARHRIINALIGTHYSLGQIELHFILIASVMKLNKLQQQALLIKDLLAPVIKPQTTLSLGYFLAHVDMDATKMNKLSAYNCTSNNLF